jgi:hypothetical protein
MMIGLQSHNAVSYTTVKRCAFYEFEQKQEIKAISADGVK